jgi:hypothetical protein
LIEGSLRLTYDVEVFSACADAVFSLLSNPPTLILCEVAALVEPGGELLQEKIAEMNDLGPPIVLLTNDVPDEGRSLRKLKIEPVGYLARSTRPQMLDWLVSNWIAPDRPHKRLNASDMTEKCSEECAEILGNHRNGPDRASKPSNRGSRILPLRRPIHEPTLEHGSARRKNGRSGNDSSDSLLWASRLLFLMSHPEVT